MTDNRSCAPAGKDMVCIDTYRVLDSCRDKDCFEDVRVYLTEEGQEIIDHTGAVRVKSARVLSSDIDANAMPFNRGFYQLTIRIYVKIVIEACLAPGDQRELSGVCAVEKKVVLFGSEGNISVFRSAGGCSGFCGVPGAGHCSAASNLPIAVLETVDPLVLNSRIAEPRRRCFCCCSVEEIPENVCGCIPARLIDCETSNQLLVSLGFFSVVRLERPAQYLVNGVEFCVPEKECIAAQDDDPCSVFRKMKFPVAEFCPPDHAESTFGSACACDSEPVRKCCSGS